MTFFSKLTSKRKYVWITIILWVLAAGLLSAAPSANDYTINTGENDLPEDAQSVITSEKVKEYFPNDDGLLALLVFSTEEEWTSDNWDQVSEISEWAFDHDELNLEGIVPFHMFPDQVKELFLSENGKTLVLPATLEKGLEMAEINDTITAIDEFGNDLLIDGDLYVTGPAGIASDTIAIFTNADLVLLFSTIALVLVLLIVIYRSPLLAFLPLLAIAFVYQVVDRVLGLLASAGVFTIESQSLSIVMILLFGATTDYSLFIFSRFREELRLVENKYEAMSRAVKGVAEPLFFSGGTVLAAMLVLLLAYYGPYQNFAPTFAITIVFVLLAGLTLVPALFTLFGRKAFWPFIPSVGEETLKKNRFWGGIGSIVTKKPWLTGGIVLLFLIINALNVPSIQYSFNLLNSFPEDMSSRIGFEKMEESFPPGELAPVTVLLENEGGFVLDEDGMMAQLEDLQSQLLAVPGVYDVSLSENRGENGQGENQGGNGEEGDVENEASDVAGEVLQALRLELILEDNPYDHGALDTIEVLIDTQGALLEESGFDSSEFQLYFAGETASQSDVRALSNRDTIVIGAVVTLVILIMLVWHTRSIVAPVYMMATILLSYLSALGISWFLFENFLGFEEMSYRIPLYSFVFLVALGVDYNIMLISRIREENKKFHIRDAVQRGVALTGGVISSAGVILAATFAVLTTQPIMELFLFGFIVSLGILMDAFLIRGMLVPAIVTVLGKWNWWPSKDAKLAETSKTVVEDE
ncbi:MULTISPECIES: MMPL family transporter [Bacillaceae]|uniref:MMPL family transporter n=1 Tax=Evansella alkalicola TaxID=745819 RepID=A0ABS6JVK0_9BACI|nr:MULTISPECIES: MMPL family transporter [Bacillaceae]MBU9721272.1 MMPL family transporter [Bacillus alkalicola]